MTTVSDYLRKLDFSGTGFLPVDVMSERYEVLVISECHHTPTLRFRHGEQILQHAHQL